MSHSEPRTDWGDRETARGAIWLCLVSGFFLVRDAIDERTHMWSESLAFTIIASLVLLICVKQIVVGMRAPDDLTRAPKPSRRRVLALLGAVFGLLLFVDASVDKPGDAAVDLSFAIAAFAIAGCMRTGCIGAQPGPGGPSR